MKTPGFQRILLITGMSLLLAVAAFCGYKVHTLSAHEEELKRDYSTTNNISFGLLSVSKWRDLMVAAIGREIQGFNFTPPERDSLEKEVTQVLNGLVDKADSLMNAPKNRSAESYRSSPITLLSIPTSCTRWCQNFRKRSPGI